MPNPTPTQVHHTVGNDLGGTQRPSGELGWVGVALLDDGTRRREGNQFHQLTRLMGGAEMDSTKIASQKVGGPFDSVRDLRSVINYKQRSGSIVDEVGGLTSTTTPVFF